MKGNIIVIGFMIVCVLLDCFIVIYVDVPVEFFFISIFELVYSMDKTTKFFFCIENHDREWRTRYQFSGPFDFNAIISRFSWIILNVKRNHFISVILISIDWMK